MLAVVAGTMTAMADDDEIILLSYIKSTGQQAFNTNYIHKASTMVAMSCMIEQNQQRNYEALFGARLTNYTSNALCFFSRFAGKDVPCYNRSGVETQGSGLPYNRYIEVVGMGQMAAWGTDDEGLLGSITTSGTADDGKTPMLIFDLNTATTPGGVQIDGSASCVTLYDFKIYEGETNLVHVFLRRNRPLRQVYRLVQRLHHKHTFPGWRGNRHSVSRICSAQRRWHSKG